MPTALIRPASISEVQAAVRDAPAGSRLLARGGGAATALSTAADGVTLLDLAGLAGLVEYEPGEFTFTALAGTRISEIAATLAEHRQFLPFDPPLVAAGATLGGTVAAGLSGPGRYRYGGVRDFILGVRYVDGDGEVVRAGGKVVKNAAGFDIPKLMAGSLGSLGALVELTFKVFPAPEAYATLRVPCGSPDAALAILYRLIGSQMDLYCLDLAPGTGDTTLLIRLGGLAAALPDRLERLQGLTGGGEVLTGGEDAAIWRDAIEFAWAPRGCALVKVPVTPGRILNLEKDLSGLPERRYSAGGQVAWIAWPGSLQDLDARLKALDLSGLVVLGQPGITGPVRLGARAGEPLERRVKAALDPQGRFVAQ